jgi:integrase
VQLKKQWFKVKRRRRLVKDDDMRKFYAAVMTLENPVQRDFIRLVLFTGLRRRECAGLEWDAVDFKAGIIRVPSSSTKNDEPLDLPMSDAVRDVLIARRGMSGTKFVFSPANSKSGHIEEPKSALAEVAARCGVRVSVHDLRRTFASTAERSGVTFVVLKALVNHAIDDNSDDVTAGYVIVSSEQLREATQRVADRMKSLCGIAEPVARLRRRENRDA